MLAPVTCRSVRRRAQPSSMGAACLRGVRGSSARSAPRFPPISAAQAGPQAGHMRADSGCSCPGILPDNFILELVDQHHQLGQLSPAPKGALAAARTLARSPSCHAALSTPPPTSLFDCATVPSQVPLVAGSTSPPVGHAGGQPRPPPLRQQRVRRRRGGSARSKLSSGDRV